MLIVCEGDKTEPDYFNALIDDLQLNTANIKIAENTDGSSPRNVVDVARKKYKEDKKAGKETGEKFDQVYCIFDKDTHSTYREALDIIRREQQQGKRGCPIHAVTSIPCFEFWLLLHFTKTTKDFHAGRGSICANVIADLKKHIPAYEKGEMKEIYQLVKNRIPKAIAGAKQAEHHCATGGTDTPSTQVYALVEYLQHLKKQWETDGGVNAQKIQTVIAGNH